MGSMKSIMVSLLGVLVLTTASCTTPAVTRTGTPAQMTVEPSNPPIRVTLDKIGVHHNGESGLRSVIVGAPLGSDVRASGEVYVHVVVTDGKSTSKVRLPSKEGQYYQLKPDETVNVNKRLLYTGEVGDSLTITAVGYEADGGTFEQLIYKALGLAIESQVGGGILELFNFNLGDLIGRFTGAEHDFLGSYERTFSKADNWGVGRYTDITCRTKSGEEGLRLWFTIERAR